MDGKFGVLPLVTGTFIVAVGAALIALPVGLATAVYLSEYANPVVRKIIKPVLEILAGIPSIVLATLPHRDHACPQKLIPDKHLQCGERQHAIGIMTILVASERRRPAPVPDSYRHGSYALAQPVLKAAPIKSRCVRHVASFILASLAIGKP